MHREYKKSLFQSSIGRMWARETWNGTKRPSNPSCDLINTLKLLIFRLNEFSDILAGVSFGRRGQLPPSIARKNIIIYPLPLDYPGMDSSCRSI